MWPSTRATPKRWNPAGSSLESVASSTAGWGLPPHDHPLRSGAREQGIGRWGAVQHAAIEQAPEDVLALLAAIEPVAVLIEVRLQMGGAHPVEDKDCGFSRSVLERTTASGPVGHADVPGWLALADVLWAAFAHSHEASLKLMEYMTMAKPVVAAGAGQAEQSIAEAGCGSAVARKDWEGLASEACRIAAADPDVRRQLGDNGRYPERMGVFRLHAGYTGARRRVSRILVPFPERLCNFLCGTAGLARP